MPILDIEVVADGDAALIDDVAQRLADAAGEVLGTPAGRTWVRLRTLPRTSYAENGGAPDELRPVFVSLLKARRPPPDQIGDEARRLCSAIADVLRRPVENVHVLYQADAAGRIAFGGELVPDDR